jgi:hypothetical protein
MRLAIAFFVIPWITLQVAAHLALRGEERRKLGRGWVAMSIAVVVQSSLDLIFGSRSLVAEVATVGVIILAAIADVLLVSVFVQHGRAHGEE